MKKSLGILALALSLLPVYLTAQTPPPGVQQVGAVTAGDCASWVGNLYVQDSGGPCIGGTGSNIITATNSNAFAVGQTGAVLPQFNVDTSSTNGVVTVNSTLAGNVATGTDAPGLRLAINAPRGTGLGSLGTLALRASVTNQGVSGSTFHPENDIIDIGNAQTSYPALNGALVDFIGAQWVDVFSPANTTNNSFAFYNFGVNTLNALNTGITVNSATTVHIAGGPSIGTNTSATTSSALRIDNGTSTSAQTISYGAIIANTSLASGSSTTGNSGNIGTSSGANGAATGQNVGVYGSAANSTLRNYGGAFQSTVAGTAPNVGVVGTALNGSTNTAGYFGLRSSGLSPLNTVIQAEAGTSGEPFFLASINSVPVFDLNATGLIRIYNGVTTAGLGVPAVVGQANIAAQTVASTITSYANPAVDGEFEVSAQINVSAAAAISTALTVSYTDVNNTAQTMILPLTGQAGSFITNGLVITTGTFESVVVNIRAKASSSITVQTAPGTFTGVTYSASGTIKQTG